jgi:hypothetical protein
VPSTNGQLKDGNMKETRAQEDLKKLIKESIREVLREERLTLMFDFGHVPISVIRRVPLG